MTPEQVFDQFPEAQEIYKAGNSEFFLSEDEADSYCKHFNVKKEKFSREAFFEVVEENDEQENESKPNKKPTKAELKAKEEADAKIKADAEAKAKEEADAKAAAE